MKCINQIFGGAFYYIRYLEVGHSTKIFFVYYITLLSHNTIYSLQFNCENTD